MFPKTETTWTHFVTRKLPTSQQHSIPLLDTPSSLGFPPTLPKLCLELWPQTYYNSTLAAHRITWEPLKNAHSGPIPGPEASVWQGHFFNFPDDCSVCPGLRTIALSEPTCLHVSQTWHIFKAALSHELRIEAYNCTRLWMSKTHLQMLCEGSLREGGSVQCCPRVSVATESKAWKAEADFGPTYGCAF